MPHICWRVLPQLGGTTSWSLIPLLLSLWVQFQTAFRAAHVSAGAMSLKKKEFRSLRQGGRTVNAYVDEFNNLARYAPNDVNTDAARQEKFLEGLNDELSLQLTVATFNNCQELIDKAIVLEGKQHAIENRKRKYNNNNRYNSGPPSTHPRLPPAVLLARAPPRLAGVTPLPCLPSIKDGSRRSDRVGPQAQPASALPRSASPRGPW